MKHEEWRKNKPQWVKNAEESLVEYYGEPVRPVSQYCDAFRQWEKALRVLAETKGDSEYEQHRINQWGDVIKAIDTLKIPIYKSSYLGRRIYGGETHREEECPIHKGEWSGLSFKEEPCGCHLTGWIYQGVDGE
jgi:hypothetical protein